MAEDIVTFDELCRNAGGIPGYTVGFLPINFCLFTQIPDPDRIGRLIEFMDLIGAEGKNERYTIYCHDRNGNTVEILVEYFDDNKSVKFASVLNGVENPEMDLSDEFPLKCSYSHGILICRGQMTVERDRDLTNALMQDYEAIYSECVS